MTESKYVHIAPFLAGSKPIKAWVRGIELGDASTDHSKIIDMGQVIYDETRIVNGMSDVGFEHAQIEASALNQLYNVASLPFIHHHVAVMPDVHWGMGATVGSVIPTKGAVVPAAVGVDIGCGMCAVKTNLKASDLPDNLYEIRHSIERTVPVGKNSHREISDSVKGRWLGGDPDLQMRYSMIAQKHPKVVTRNSPALQIGTLGGGNHFIELCLDTEQNVWIMLHSGSRNLGKTIGEYFITAAKKEMERMFIHLPDKDLAYLVERSELFNDYVEAVSFAQDYAMQNREAMLYAVLKNLEHYFPHLEFSDAVVNCHHNYISREHHFGENVLVTRKGAVRARLGDYGIIPGSMGTRSYIVRGLGNPDSFCSCSHGAGRRMSRGEANRRISLEDHAAATAGVECRKDAGVIDESPAAYKNIESVMAAQSDLVEVVTELKQILCVKG